MDTRHRFLILGCLKGVLSTNRWLFHIDTKTATVFFFFRKTYHSMVPDWFSSFLQYGKWILIMYFHFPICYVFSFLVTKLLSLKAWLHMADLLWGSPAFPKTGIVNEHPRIEHNRIEYAVDFVLGQPIQLLRCQPTSLLDTWYCNCFPFLGYIWFVISMKIDAKLGTLLSRD